MVTFLIASFVGLVSAFINRFRDGGITELKFPVHRRFVCLPLMVVLVAGSGLLLGSSYPFWFTVGSFTAAWLTWSLIPWGRVYDISLLNDSVLYDSIGMMLVGAVPTTILLVALYFQLTVVAAAIILLYPLVSTLSYIVGAECVRKKLVYAHTQIAGPVVGAWWGFVAVAVWL